MLDFNLRYRLSYQSFQQLIRVFEDLANPENTLWITAEVISSEAISLKALGWAEFYLFLSEKFKALILTGNQSSVAINEVPQLDVGLTFETEAIAHFCQELSRISEISGDRLSQINHACRYIKSNDPKIQSDFTLRLLKIFSNNYPETSTQTPPLTHETAYPSVWICQPIENALQQQIKQEKLLYKVTTQVRQSLELPVILSTAVEEVRRCLEVDRLLIYEFHQNSKNYPLSAQKSEQSVGDNSQLISSHQTQLKSLLGCTTYESRSSQEIPAILELDIDDALVLYLKINNTELKQFPLVINDISTAYHHHPKVLEFLQKAHVKSELLSPIVVENDLWGLVIAHQCSEIRQWQKNDQIFLGDIAEHLAIAIRQALLYRQVQQQKQTLEERVKTQTQNLRDALIAAESANRSKSEFLAAMSHELRTPLTCVIGMSSTLLRWSFGQLSEKQRHYLKTIHNSGEHLLELINDILELSQLEAGKAVLNLEEISLIQFVEQMMKGMAEKAIKAEILLNTDLQISPKNDRFFADLRRLKQIFYNLLSNAIKFTPAGGQVTVRLWREDPMIVVEIEDTGVGISEDHQPLIFNKFQQLDSSYHRNYEGTGLGLALTKQLVELHGGWINVRSAVGVGSTFTVQLPMNKNYDDRKLLEISQPKVKQSSLGGIVLIEEDEKTATNFCDLLTDAGYHVVWIVDGSNALLQIEVLEPEVVIIDTPLWDIDACEIIESLRQNSQIKKLKILVLMNNKIPKDLTNLWEAGADDYLIKPFNTEALFKKIKALCEQ